MSELRQITDLTLARLEPDLLALVDAENRAQLFKWGVQSRTSFEWLAYLTEELGELASAIAEHEYRGGSRADIVNEGIQVATLVLKIVEMFLPPFPPPEVPNGH